jgi:hypothetical protein
MVRPTYEKEWARVHPESTLSHHPGQTTASSATTSAPIVEIFLAGPGQGPSRRFWIVIEGLDVVAEN